MRSAAIISLLSLLQAGCHTAATKSQGGWGKPYSGARCAHRGMSFWGKDSIVLRASFVPDLVLSAVADTVLLPVDFVVDHDPERRYCSVK
ncbi:MAG: hypothetical protein CO113_00905 [Elusimicrobia bacterium CG_4_9_14_3_um_filter_62_55]|nr:MAG: hypothetical protein COR54_15795 [Elusimicrobia bacterium CG22_combo_CG10-13_8_21_14_all_63_91]PJA15306.1 MAG: hypothetical protein COX66_10295 [Elusimicrobia bacterium CG_4_10_14_0_2_um_filter_63_34]PJB27010.1 MAG: hypothetical protein CO113_00905 [Elusimicrobia bacterium CG_4_9_14_3_um_filter_62_55]